MTNTSQVRVDSVLVPVSSNGAVVPPSDDDSLDPAYTGESTVSTSFDGFVQAGRVLVLDAPGFLETVAESSGTYEVAIRTGASSAAGSAITDTSPARNPLADVVWRFSSLDTVAPTIVSGSPAIDSTDVAFGTTNLRLLMSEAVQQGEGTIEVVNTESGLAVAVLDASRPSVVRITSALGATARTVELRLPSSTLRSYGLRFALRLPTGFVEDQAGNPFQGLLTVAAGAPSYRVEPDTYPPSLSSRRTSVSSSSQVLRLEDTGMDGGESVAVLSFGESVRLPARGSGAQLHVYRMPDGAKVASVPAAAGSDGSRMAFVGGSASDATEQVVAQR